MALIESVKKGGGSALLDALIGKEFKGASSGGGASQANGSGVAFIPCAGLTSIVADIAHQHSGDGYATYSYQFYDDTDTAISGATDSGTNYTGTKNISVPSNASYFQLALSGHDGSISGSSWCSFTITAIS